MVVCIHIQINKLLLLLMMLYQLLLFAVWLHNLLLFTGLKLYKLGKLLHSKSVVGFLGRVFLCFLFGMSKGGLDKFACIL